jgi:hypothetical protein
MPISAWRRFRSWTSHFRSDSRALSEAEGIVDAPGFSPDIDPDVEYAVNSCLEAIGGFATNLFPDPDASVVGLQAVITKRGYLFD